MDSPTQAYDVAMIQRAEEITIRVDAQAASMYRSASEDERQRLDMLLSLRLSEAAGRGQPLQQIMQDISRRAGTQIDSRSTEIDAR